MIVATSLFRNMGSGNSGQRWQSSAILARARILSVSVILQVAELAKDVPGLLPLAMLGFVL